MVIVNIFRVWYYLPMSKENDRNYTIGAFGTNPIILVEDPPEGFGDRLDFSSIGECAVTYLLLQQPTEIKNRCVEAWKRKDSVFLEYFNTRGEIERIFVTGIKVLRNSTRIENTAVWIRFDDGDIDIELEFE